jgi:hypothetical protein
MILIDRDTLQMTFIGGEAMFKELDEALKAEVVRQKLKIKKNKNETKSTDTK